MPSLADHLVLVLLAAAVSVPAPVVLAQDETVWAAAAFVMYGERTPLIGPTPPELTPLGAQQMYAQGAAFRDRFLVGDTTAAGAAAAAPIDGIELDALDNNQLALLSTNDAYVAAGAQAFVQGLYPPQTDTYAYGNGGRAAALLANGSLVTFPLDGYQYPLVATASVQDPNFAWIAGHVSCTQYEATVLSMYGGSGGGSRSSGSGGSGTTATINTGAADGGASAAVFSRTRGFYDALYPTVFQAAFPPGMVNYDYAYTLYDYARYQYDHAPDGAAAVGASGLNSSTLEILKLLATTQQLDRNANLTVAGRQPGDMVLAVSGRMLAAEIVSLLRENIAAGGATHKLSLLFGSFEPLLAFFALSGLTAGPAGLAFQTLPDPAGAMVFELYTPASLLRSGDADAGSNTTMYPSEDDIYVRFLYRNNSEPATPFVEFALFSDGTTDTAPAAPLRFVDFANAMDAVGILSVAAWCTLCDAVSVFCPALVGDGGGSGSNSNSNSNGSSSNRGNRKTGPSPAVAGVIGALVTLAVGILLVLAAMLLGGMRVYVAGRRRRGSLGDDDSGDNNEGFKGTERKAADTDVTVTKGGATHERVGSWELRSSSSSSNNNNNNHAGNGGGVKNGLHTTAGGTGHTDAPDAAGSDNGGNPRAERVRSTILNRALGDGGDGSDEDELLADLGAAPVRPREHV
ncbi:histidine acid phosphatase [Niveomyces insectorum RCEF 264]|uniref:Histidine acid phosphatase n=1 Tax=Niveomyces insectorum RCEF 264 TaxID=1081102 RepID=A0A167QC97_9HYPO|nr:histidine acid phosphatase [Niveomyces insectorum RCEF 264]